MVGFPARRGDLAAIEMAASWRRLDHAERDIREGRMSIEAAAAHWNVSLAALKQRFDPERERMLRIEEPF